MSEIKVEIVMDGVGLLDQVYLELNSNMHATTA